MSGINNESSLFNSEERKGELEKEFSSYIKKSDFEQSGLQSFPENEKIQLRLILSHYMKVKSLQMMMI